MDEGRRRPRVDWDHTANVQGNAVRDYVKWDYQPGGIQGVPDSFARAYSVMMTEPQGPIYMCYDAWLQEAPLTEEVKLPKPSTPRVPGKIAPDMKALEVIADRLVSAEWPVLLPQYVGRVASGMTDMVALAEAAGAAVSDVQSRLNFPPQHSLDMRMNKDVFKQADVILSLDCRDWERPTHYNDRINRTLKAHYPDHCEWLDIGFADLEISKWATGYQKFPECAARVLADTELAIPALTELVRARVAKDAKAAKRIEDRKLTIGEMHDKQRAKWRAEAREGWDDAPISVARLACDVWELIKDEDWVLTTQAFEDWALKLWDFDKHYRWPGKALGTGTQIGMAIGVALAHRGTGRLVLDCQTDGDLMFDASALWFAAKHEIPLLCVMHNNRAYYNDWEHQITVARQRGTDEDKAYIGMDIRDPEPDFGKLARSMGWYGEGPVKDPKDIKDAVRRGIEQVKKGKPALIDIWTKLHG
jgi:acetolactate synthase-1/2/3 large subunit